MTEQSMLHLVVNWEVFFYHKLRCRVESPHGASRMLEKKTFSGQGSEVNPAGELTALAQIPLLAIPAPQEHTPCS